MPPRMVSASEHIKASLSAGVYTNKHGGTHVYLVRVCFLFGQICRAADYLVGGGIAVGGDDEHRQFIQTFCFAFGRFVESFDGFCAFR